ncbi:MAG: DEAD/DEAH box helicase family protein [Acidimicrobiales bacterium]
MRAFLDKVGREKDIEGGRRDFLAVACPGAGKTTFALTAVRHWLAGQRRLFVVVVPTRHLKAQCGRAPPTGSASTSSPSGRAATRRCRPTCTASWSPTPRSRRRRAPCGRSATAASSSSTRSTTPVATGRGAPGSRRRSSTPRRLLLSGTPFRSDDAPIPFVTYTLE